MKESTVSIEMTMIEEASTKEKSRTPLFILPIPANTDDCIRRGANNRRVIQHGPRDGQTVIKTRRKPVLGCKA